MTIVLQVDEAIYARLVIKIRNLKTKARNRDKKLIYKTKRHTNIFQNRQTKRANTNAQNSRGNYEVILVSLLQIKYFHHL